MSQRFGCGNDLPQLGVIVAGGRGIYGRMFFLHPCAVSLVAKMGLGLRSCCSWLVLVSLVYSVECGCAGDCGLVRQRRQSDWWRSYQQAAPRQGSSQWGSRGLYWGGNQGALGAFRGGIQRGSSGERGFPTGDSPISLQCEEDTMMVRVYRDFYGTGKMVNPSDLSLGPQRCKPNSQSTEMVVFQVNLQDCGNAVQMTRDWVIYTTNLTYSPTSSIPVIRTNPAVVPIICYYYRHANVSSEAIKPTWFPFSTTVSSEERLSFALRLMTEDWSGPRSSPIFELGQILYIEASLDTHNHMDLVLYVDRCVATISPDTTSAPSYDIITDNGCLVDGVQDDASSAFIARRTTSDKLQFTVDAFRFLGADVSLIYITCFLRAAATTQVPDSRNKACSYNKATKGWFAVEGPSSVCQCCERLTCLPPAVIPPMSAGGRGRFDQRPRQRAFGKREALDEPNIEGQTVTMLGPLLVTGSKQRPATHPVRQEESAPVALWVLVAIGCLALLVVFVCVVFIRRSLKKPQHAFVVK